MKKLVCLISVVLILFIFSTLNAFEVKFGEGKPYEGVMRPLIFNATVLDYYDNGTKYTTQFPIIIFELKIISENFDPYKANVYAIINNDESFKIKTFLEESLINVYPSYVDSYMYTGKIFPQMFSENFDLTGYNNMLDQIDNITIYLNYEGDQYSITYDFSKYREFLKTFYNPITSIDTSNFPVVNWISNEDNLNGIGISLLYGDEDKWDNESISSRYKTNNDRAFGAWFINDNKSGHFNMAEYINDNSFDFSSFPGMILDKDLYIFKIKTFEPYYSDYNNKGYTVLRFFAGFKKVPTDKVEPITTVSGWKLLGTDESLFIDQMGDIFNLSKVNTIWAWVNNSWRIWSPDATIEGIIENYGLTKLNVIYPNRGFWVNFK
jgi:hypothetical protein